MLAGWRLERGGFFWRIYVKYYIYGHYIPGDREPFYIGKGHSKRAWNIGNRNFWWNNIVKKYGLEVKILYENLTENEAFNIEKQLITEYGRRDKNSGCLVNLTDGGEGVSGLIYTEEMKKRIYNDNWKRGILRGAEKRKHDPKWRENKIKSCKELANREDWIKIVEEKNKKMSNDPCWIEKQKEGINKFYNNPEKRKRWIERHKIGLNKFYNDPEKRKIHKLAVTKPRSKYFGKVRCPEGNVYEVYNVPKFCKERNLVIISFRRMKKHISRTYKGWTYLGS
jgi:hypothetical protein